MSQFDALIDDLDRFQRWEARKARKNAVPPQPRPAPALSPGRPAQSFAKSIDAIAAEVAELRRQTAQQNARLRAQNADAERQREYAKLNEIMSKADALAGEGRITAAEIGAIELRCNALAARLQKQDRTAKAAGASR